MGKEKHLIPWYARDNFDFKLYHVCRKGREELKRFYDKPTLQLDHKERVVLENKILYDALVRSRGEDKSVIVYIGDEETVAFNV